MAHCCLRRVWLLIPSLPVLLTAAIAQSTVATQPTVATPATVAAPATAVSQTTAAAQPADPAPAASATLLSQQLQPVLEAHQGDVAVCVRHLESGVEYQWRADVPQPTASLIKLAVMVTAYRQADAGQLDLKRPLTLTEADKVEGSGILTSHFSAGLTLSVRDAIRLMIRYSDNTATNLVVGQIGLPATAATMEQLGFPNTKLHALVFRRDTSIFPERSQQFGLGSTTARETVDLLAQLHAGRIASAASCEAMLEHLLQCDAPDRIEAGLPPRTRFAHKTGSVSDTRTDAGIILSPGGPIAICVLTTGNADTSWTEDNAANRLCADIGRIVYDHFNPPQARGSSASPAPLQTGDSGELVELLQRTLNARLEPSPALSVDGEFGSVTAAAVRRFQESRALPATGSVDAATWSALGPVVSDEEVPIPELVNAEVLPLEPADQPDDLPVVTCRAWTLVDLANGQPLWQHAADTQLAFASTTKIMTAWLVVQLAQQQPEILDETLTMSDRADQTNGSTSSVRSGEQLPVREALYGLMLPSGNDMSVALAEHFGARLAAALPSDAADAAVPPTAAPATDPLSLFVQAMNAEAARLGMTGTHYCNPHGLTEDEHLSTAADLAVLTRTALSSELFRQYVNTRQRGATVQGASGYQRHVLWKNTNQLLGIEGYSGVKTGTTDRAGACLVSTSERGGRRLLLVVLGSAASESRYADSRNLYRWAWKQLEAAAATGD